LVWQAPARQSSLPGLLGRHCSLISAREGGTEVTVTGPSASHPLQSWLDALRPGGRLVMPMTTNRGAGSMLLTTHQDDTEFAARFVCPVGFIEFAGACDRKSRGLLPFPRAPIGTK
jgi:hypothetical protein